jgi:hypothetical protein
METKLVIKSKFDVFMATAIILATILCIGLLIWMIYEWIIDDGHIGLFQRIIITFFPALVLPLVVKIELPKIKRIEVHHKSIKIINPFIGRTRSIDFDRFDGYQTIIHITRSGLVKEIFLISENKVVHEISENYIKNYDEIKRVIARKLKYLGPIEFRYFKYIKERLLK